MEVKRTIGCLLVATLCCTAYFQLFSRTIITFNGPNAQEIIAAAEAIRNAAVTQPHKFGIHKTDVHTLRVTDSVPSSKAGVRHVYLAQEVGGVPISNTLLSTVVKLAPSSDDISVGGGGNYLRGTAAEYAMPSKSATTNTDKQNDIIKIASSKHGQALVKNADNCVNTNEPVLTAEEALSLTVSEVLGVNNVNLRRRVLKADNINSNKDIRQKSVFEPHDGISINDTPCQLSYWSIASYDNTDEGDCNIRLAWECVVKPNRTNYMHIFVDAVEGTIIHLNKFGPEGENDEKDGKVGSNIVQQQTDPSRRRLSAFSAVQYPNENPCPSCPQFRLNMTESDKTFDIADVESLTLVQNPEFIDSSPSGWLKIGGTTFGETRGNNARVAFSVIQDSADPYSSGVTTYATDPSSNVFDYSDQSVIHENNVGLTRLDDPLSTSLEAAVVNAFYWANIIHDIYYQYGFNEESGNFQEENFGRGGKGGDSVIVEVREASTFNNAFFVNGKDGENPLLLLYLFIKGDATVLEVDGEEYKATPFAFGPTEFNLPDAPIEFSRGRVCQYLKDNVYAGSIVVIDSYTGDCTYSTKVKNAQNRGAAAVILVVEPWDRPGSFSMEDADASIDIPSVSITKADAERLQASLQPTSKSVLGPGLIVRDGAFDNSIIIHEYCHGITTRLTGGPSTTMCLNQDTNRELGKEGWEDICSLFITATNTTGRTRVIGSFAAWSINGIRPFPYSTDMNINPTTYDYLNSDPGHHSVGALFGSMLWDFYWAMIDHEEATGHIGFNENKYDSQTGGSNIAMQLIVEGLKTQPCSPSFVQSRDAIVTADELLYDGRYKCVILEAFAKRGLGESAVASPFGITLNVTEAFDVPAYCMGPMLSLTSYNYTIGTGDGDLFIDDCELLTLTISFQNAGFGNLSDVQLVDLSSNLGKTIIMNKLPMQLLDLPERAQMSINVDLKVEGLVFGQPLELEAKFTAVEAVEPLSIFVTFTETSTDVVAKEKVTWEFGVGDNDWTSMDGYFALEPSRSSLTVNDTSLATLDAERKEILSSFLSLPKQCNRVRSPSFVLYDNSAISIWVNFGINGMTDGFIYDRANVGLFSKGERVTIEPDGGHQYNSYGAVNSKNVETCPAPGNSGWRIGTGSAFKEVVFSSDALQDANMIGETVQLDIALATGVDTYGSYFSIQRVELTNVGIPMPDEGSVCAMASAAPIQPSPSSSSITELNSTFTTSSLPDSELPLPGSGLSAHQNDLIEGNIDKDQGQVIGGNVNNEDEGRVGGLGGGLVFLILLAVAIPVATLGYLTHRRKKMREELEQARNFCELANGSDLENPMHVLEAVEVSLYSAVVPVPVAVAEKDEQDESQNDDTADDARRTFSALTESLSSSSASLSAPEEEKEKHDVVVGDEGSSRMMSFINSVSSSFASSSAPEEEENHDAQSDEDMVDD